MELLFHSPNRWMTISASSCMDSPLPFQLFNESNYALPFSEAEVAFLFEIISDQQECGFEFVELVFVDENEIVNINKKHLERDYITDIISFRYDDDPTTNNAIEGTLFCCAPRIAEQALQFDATVYHEFLRVIIHGLIHLIGYDDQTEEEKKEMTRLEDHFLSMITNR